MLRTERLLEIPHFSGGIRAIRATGNTERREEEGGGRGSERCTFSLTVVALINQGETELDTRFREEKGERTWVIRWLVPPVFPPAIQFAGVSRPAALFLLDK